MKTLALIFTLSLYSTAHASGSYSFSSPTRSVNHSPPPPSIPTGGGSGGGDYAGAPNGEEKSIKTLKSYIYGQKREGVSIHNVFITGNRYIIEGVYVSLDKLKDFMKRLEYPEHLKKTLRLRKWSTRFAGRKTWHFKIESPNRW